MLRDELLVKLESLPKTDLEWIIYKLLISKKLDYTALSSKYVKYLERTELDNTNKLVEAETCLMEHLLTKKTKTGIYEAKNKQENTAIQRSLYLLNKSGRHNLIYFNKQFKYDEETAKQLSWYERQRVLYDI